MRFFVCKIIHLTKNVQIPGSFIFDWQHGQIVERRLTAKAIFNKFQFGKIVSHAATITG